MRAGDLQGAPQRRARPDRLNDALKAAALANRCKLRRAEDGLLVLVHVGVCAQALKDLTPARLPPKDDQGFDLLEFGEDGQGLRHRPAADNRQRLAGLHLGIFQAVERFFERDQERGFGGGDGRRDDLLRVGEGVIGLALLRPYVGDDSFFDEAAPAASSAGVWHVFIAQGRAQHAVADLEAAHLIAQGDDPSDRFVAQQHGEGAAEELALDQLAVGAVADGASLDLDQRLVGAGGWFGQFQNPQLVFGGNEKTFHDCSSLLTCPTGAFVFARERQAKRLLKRAERHHGGDLLDGRQDVRRERAGFHGAHVLLHLGG